VFRFFRSGLFFVRAESVGARYGRGQFEIRRRARLRLGVSDFRLAKGRAKAAVFRKWGDKGAKFWVMAELGHSTQEIRPVARTYRENRIFHLADRAVSLSGRKRDGFHKTKIFRRKETARNSAIFVLFSFWERILRCCVKSTAAPPTGCKDARARHESIAGPMFVSRDREKLINAIIFFSQKTKHCHTLKLFKLLNLLDFEHFRQTGRTVTGLDYSAWDNGPVPPALFQEIKSGLKPDLAAAVSIRDVREEFSDKLLRREIRTKAKFHPGVFTTRERKILDHLAEVFLEARGDDMRDFSHINGLPWKKVYGKGEGRSLPIDPALAFDSEPMLHKEPNIDNDELEYRKELLRGTA